MAFVEFLFKLVLTNTISNSILEFYSSPTASECMMKCITKHWCVGVFYSKFVQNCGLVHDSVNLVSEQGWNYYHMCEDICPKQLDYTLVYLPAPLCYKVYDDLQMSQTAGQSRCEADGGSLITLDTPEKNDFIRYTLMNMDVSDYIRIGLEETNGTWVWPTGSNLSYTQWAKDEPNELENEYCAILTKASGYYWADYVCQNPKHFACEIHVSN